jgi:hypothetical protein
MGYIEPDDKVPSRTHITSICRKKYDTIKEEIFASLSIVPNVVAQTSGMWTSRATQAYGDGDSSLHHRGLEDREEGSFNPRDA